MWATDQMRPPLFHRLLSQHPAPHTPEDSSRLLPGSSSLPWPSLSPEQLGSLLFPLPRANMTTLQDSRDVTGCCFAPLSPGGTPLQHIRSPRCTWCLLHGLLVVTTTGLSPTSKRQLVRTHQRVVSRIVLSHNYQDRISVKPLTQN